MVACNRSDGLAFDAINRSKIKPFIISSEKNIVVTKRAQKLNVPVIGPTMNKVGALKEISKKEGIDLSKSLYVGNDLNDYFALQVCGLSACPSDAHNLIKEKCTFELKSKGGAGVVMEIVEEIIKLDILGFFKPE